MKRVAIALLFAIGMPACADSRAKMDAQPDHAAHGSAPAAVPHSEHAGAHEGHDADAGAPAGYAAMTIDPAAASAIQLSSAPVEDRTFTKVLRTVGVVALDETRSAHVHPKVRGWIDGIQVNFIGKKVKPGQPLCSIYSQEVYAAEVEFLAIVERANAGAPAVGEFAAAEKQAQAQLTAGARRRLALWDVPESEIARLEASHEARRTFPLLAPREGIVVAKQAIEGMYVDPSLELYALADLSRVWVLADVYEADLPYVHVGGRAQLSVEGRAQPIDAVVDFIPPTVDEATRTVKARFIVDNKDATIRPGAFVSVTMDLPLGTGLSIPESAVVRTGTRTIVFVVHGEHIAPREIALGPLIGDRYRVTSGISSGEQVATGAQFLLDSESRLRATSAPGGGHVH